MKITTNKTLKMKLRGKDQWEPPRAIHGFREDGTDLVVLDAHGLEQARLSAGKVEQWVVEGHVDIEP